MISNKREDGGLPYGRADYLNMYRIAERIGVPNEDVAEIVGVTIEEANDETVDVDKELREYLDRRERKQRGRQGQAGGRAYGRVDDPGTLR